MIAVGLLPVADVSERDLHINDAQRLSTLVPARKKRSLQFVSFSATQLMVNA